MVVPGLAVRHPVPHTRFSYSFVPTLYITVLA
jgi:hypothetical protein